MDDERDIQAICAQAVSIMVWYHNSERARRTTQDMSGLVQALASKVHELTVRPAEIDDHLLCPVQAELVVRYGPEAGGRVNAEFLKAFESLGAA